MKEDELKTKLVNDIPEAGPHYWNRIDAALKNIEVTQDFSIVDPLTGSQTVELDRGKLPQQVGNLAANTTAVPPSPNTRIEEPNKFKKAMFSTAAGFALLACGGFLFISLNNSSTEDSTVLDSFDESEADLFQEEESFDQSEQRVAEDSSVEAADSSELSDDAAADSVDEAVSTSTTESEDLFKESGWFSSLEASKEFDVNSNVQFDTNSNNQSFDGVISANQFSVYSFTAVKDQNLIMVLSSVENDVTYSIYGPEEELLAENQILAEVDLENSGEHFVVIQTTNETEAEFEVSLTIE